MNGYVPGKDGWEKNSGEGGASLAKGLINKKKQSVGDSYPENWHFKGLKHEAGMEEMRCMDSVSGGEHGQRTTEGFQLGVTQNTSWKLL